MNRKELVDLIEKNQKYIKAWFLGEYMTKTSEPTALISFIKQIKDYLPTYQNGYLYRWTWIDKKDVQLIKNAKTIRVKSGKKKTQSWTDDLKVAKHFGDHIGSNSGRLPNTKVMCIIGSTIPGSKILFTNADLTEFLKPFNRELSTIWYGDTIIDLLKDYKDQREWILYLDTTVKVEEFHLMEEKNFWDYKYTQIAGEFPDEITIVIDDPDTGESHIEFPDTNVVPFKREEPLQQAASLKRKNMSFQSKFLNAGGYLEDDDIIEAAAKPEVGDLVEPINNKSNIKYEILEVLENGNVKLKPLEGGLGSFTQNMNTLKVVQPKNPKPRQSRDPAEALYREEALTRLNYGKYVKKIVDRLDAHAADIADDVYNQFKDQFQDSDVHQDQDVDDAIKVAINDAISDAMGDFNVPSYLEDIVREEALKELHYPGGR